jgi:hypothetical protein
MAFRAAAEHDGERMTSKDLRVERAAIDAPREGLVGRAAEPERSAKLTAAAAVLVADYEMDEELLTFTSLDAEPFHPTE